MLSMNGKEDKQLEAQQNNYLCVIQSITTAHRNDLFSTNSTLEIDFQNMYTYGRG